MNSAAPDKPLLSASLVGAMLEVTSEPVIVVDARGGVVGLNRAAFATLGISDELGDMSPAVRLSRVKMTDLDGVPVTLERSPGWRALSGETVRDQMQRATLADGRQLVLSVSATPVRDDGQVVGAVLRFQDRTDREQEAQALREARLELETLADQAGDVVLVHELDGRIVQANDVACLALGWSEAELLRVNVFDVAVELDAATASARWQQLRPGQSFSRLSRLRSRDGRELPFEIRIAAIERAGRRCVHVVARDVSAEVEAQRRLAEERDRLQVTLTSIGDAVVATDGDGRVVLMNPTAERLTGWAAEEAKGRLLTEIFRLIDEEGRRPVRDPVEVVLEEGAVVGLGNHTILIGRDGVERPIVDSAAPIRGADGRISGVVLVFRDQTEERRAERERAEAASRLARSEARLRLLAENSRDVIWMFDLASRRYTYVSPSITRLRGLTVAEAMAEPIERSLTPESLERVEAILARLGTQADLGHTEVLDQPHQDGSIRHVEVTATLIVDEAGRPIEVLGVSRDVTARVVAERALRQTERQRAESEARLRLFIEHAPAAVAMFDRELRYLAVSRRYLADYRLPTGEVVGRSHYEIFPEIPERWKEIHRRCLAGAVERCEDDPFPRGDGTVDWVRWEIHPWRHLNGEVGGLILFSEITTEQHAAAERLGASERRYRALIEKSLEMVILLDAAGRITFWPPSAVVALGWPAGEVTGTPLVDLLHPGDQERFEGELARQATVYDKSALVPLRARHARGGTRLLEGVVRDLQDDPAVGAFVVNLRDVTAQRELEEKFRQSQKLESIGRLAGGVAHDFNNLLTVILTSAEVIMEAQQSGQPLEIEDVEQIRAAGERAKELTRQLLAFARKQVIAPVRLDLNSVVRSSERLLRRILREDVGLEVRIHAGLWPVMADPGQIEQVLMNLAVNARDAMTAGGTLVIETSQATVTGEDALVSPGLRPGDWVRLIVQDDGTGMSAEVREHLFEPFFTTKEQGKGTGLGLATVHGIVAQAGGHIRVESEPGRGTCFTICLPRNAGPAVAVEPRTAPGTLAGHEHLLLVEDDPTVRTIALRSLTSAGYQVLAAGDGAQALALVRRLDGPLDLVITDVIMPGPRAGEVARQLQALRPGVPVLYMSGYTDDAISEHGVLAAGTHFLPKPFTAAELLTRVRQVLAEGATKAPGTGPAQA